MRGNRFSRMRILSAFCGAALVAAASLPALAAEPGPEPDEAPMSEAESPEAASTGATSEDREENRLSSLFAQLKRERNEKAAERIASRIWEAWGHSGSASIDLMMGWSKTAMDAKKFDVALDFLDQVVTIQPAYAEGWNRRATVHFMMQNYAKSMADINHTLQLEPRHFGALSGMGQILKSAGSNELALQAYQRVLDIYPMMRNAQNEVATLSEELAGEGI
jgi:tetratricopeptide (TPR) repeat protein